MKTIQMKPPHDTTHRDPATSGRSSLLCPLLSAPSTGNVILQQHTDLQRSYP